MAIVAVKVFVKEEVVPEMGIVGHAVRSVKRPSAIGTWQEQPQLAGAIQRCLEVFENQRPPAFVALPCTIK